MFIYYSLILDQMSISSWYTGSVEPTFKSWTYNTIKMKNGNVYKGTLIRGLRSGYGLCCSEPYFYGVMDENTNTQSLIHWTEYKGDWRYDKPHGFGILRQMRGDGLVTLIYQGEWKYGEKSDDV